MTPSDRDRIVDLLQDPSLSYRAIGRELGVSDWTVRRVARDLDGDSRPMKQPPYEDELAEVSPIAGWLVFGGIAIVLGVMIWACVRATPPPEL